MPEMTTIANDALARCEERTRRLAQEKSYLQLVNNLMLRLGEETGLDAVVQNLLRLLLDNLGGSNVSFYYRMGADLYWADVYGKREKIDTLEDAIVQRVFAEHEFVEVEHDFERTKMLTPEFTKASTWAAPLMAGNELVGVLRLEDMLMAAREIRQQLEPFFRYAALVLRNEVSGYAKLKRAYEELGETNARLSSEIRQRLKVEEALFQEREFGRSLLESMVDGVVACDADGTLTLFNRTAREWHGMDPMRLPPEEWAKQYDLYGADGTTPLLVEEVPLARAFRGETVVDAGMAIRAKGRDARFILANGSVIKDAEGKKLGAVVVMRDITELRRVEERLREANAELERAVAKRTAELEATLVRLQMELEERRRVEERLQITQFAVDSSADAIFWVRPDGSYSYWNRSACALLGYSSQDFLRLKTFDLNPEHQGEAWTAHWQELRQQGFLRFETSFVRKDASLLPVEIMANLVELNGQEYNCAFVRDISERKRAESALIDSNERFRAFMDYAPFYAYVKDHDCNHLFANRLTLELIPGPKPEVMRAADFFGAELAKKLEEADHQILEGESDFVELEYPVNIAGRDTWLRDIKFPIVLADGTRLLGGLAVDISERIRSEEEMRKSSREWIAAMDVSEDIIYLLDLERRLMRANKAFYAMTRSAPETAIGRHIVKLVHPAGEAVPCPVCVAQEEKRDLVVIMEPDHPDNPTGRPIEITLRVVRDEEGRALSMLMTLHDLTHDRKVQAELMEYREHLEELVKTRTAEIEQKKGELERMNKLFVGRELRMIELKERIKELEQRG